MGAINGLEGNRKIGSSASKGQRPGRESRELLHESKPVQTRSRHKRQPRSPRARSFSGGRRKGNHSHRSREKSSTGRSSSGGRRKGNHSHRSREKSSTGRRRGKRSCKHESNAKSCEDSEELRRSQTRDKRAKLEDKARAAKSAERLSPESDSSQPSTLKTVNSSRLADEQADMLVIQRRQHLEEARKRLEAEYERVKADETKKARRETAERRTREELSEMHRKRQAEREAAERMAASRRWEPVSAKAGVDSETPGRRDSEDSSESAA